MSCVGGEMIIFILFIVIFIMIIIPLFFIKCSARWKVFFVFLNLTAIGVFFAISPQLCMKLPIFCSGLGPLLALVIVSGGTFFLVQKIGKCHQNR